MADADVNITAGAGTKIDTRTVGAGTDENRQVVCIGDPVTNTQVALVDASNRVPVAPHPANVIGTNNSSTATLTRGAVFTSTGEDISAYASVFVNVISDVASATNGLSLQQSSNNSNWDFTDTYTIAAATGKVYAVNPLAQCFRIVYTNGGTNQTSFRLQTIYKRFCSATIRPSF